MAFHGLLAILFRAAHLRQKEESDDFQSFTAQTLKADSAVSMIAHQKGMLLYVSRHSSRKARRRWHIYLRSASCVPASHNEKPRQQVYMLAS